jgi:hypothetical protein
VTVTEPYLHTCPYCGALPLRSCLDEAGRLVGFPHLERNRL